MLTSIHCWYLGSVSSCPKQQNPANGRAAVGETQNATSSAGPAWLVAWAQVTRSSSCENENCNVMEPSGILIREASPAPRQCLKPPGTYPHASNNTKKRVQGLGPSRFYHFRQKLWGSANFNNLGKNSSQPYLFNAHPNHHTHFIGSWLEMVR